MWTGVVLDPGITTTHHQFMPSGYGATLCHLCSGVFDSLHMEAWTCGAKCWQWLRHCVGWEHGKISRWQVHVFQGFVKLDAQDNNFLLVWSVQRFSQKMPHTVKPNSQHMVMFVRCCFCTHLSWLTHQAKLLGTPPPPPLRDTSLQVVFFCRNLHPRKKKPLVPSPICHKSVPVKTPQFSAEIPVEKCVFFLHPWVFGCLNILINICLRVKRSDSGWYGWKFYHDTSLSNWSTLIITE